MVSIVSSVSSINLLFAPRRTCCDMATAMREGSCLCVNSLEISDLYAVVMSAASEASIGDGVCTDSTTCSSESESVATVWRSRGRAVAALLQQ